VIAATKGQSASPDPGSSLEMDGEQHLLHDVFGFSLRHPEAATSQAGQDPHTRGHRKQELPVADDEIVTARFD
jgi:hypothetical protein